MHSYDVTLNKAVRMRICVPSDAVQHPTGMLPRDLRALAADAAAEAAADTFGLGLCSTSPAVVEQEGGNTPLLLEQKHLDAALAQLKKRTATEVGP